MATSLFRPRRRIRVDAYGAFEDVNPLSDPATVGAKGETERLIFVDVLRVLVVVFVIVHHAAQAYGPTGGAWPVHDRVHSDWFRPFYTVNSASASACSSCWPDTSSRDLADAKEPGVS